MEESGRSMLEALGWSTRSVVYALLPVFLLGAACKAYVVHDRSAFEEDIPVLIVREGALHTRDVLPFPKDS